MLVNKQNAIDELGITEDDYIEFLGDLKAYMLEVLPQIKMNVDCGGPREEMHHLAHTVKGACRNLRFVAAGDIAFELEKWGSGKENFDPKPVYSNLVKTLEQSFAEFHMKMEA